jgi:hypothetical protein
MDEQRLPEHAVDDEVKVLLEQRRAGPLRSPRV